MTKVTRDMYDQYLVPNYSPATIIPVRGEGSRIWDQEDRPLYRFCRRYRSKRSWSRPSRCSKNVTGSSTNAMAFK